MPTEIDLNDLRQRVLAGETIPREIYRQVILTLRAGRDAATTAKVEKANRTAEAKSAKAGKVPKQTPEEAMAALDALLNIKI